jgi:pyrroline-5-carboxylate reductase
LVTSHMSHQRIGFIGTGQMARALAQGIAKSAGVTEIVGHDPVPAAAEQFQNDVPASRLLADNRSVVDQSDIIVLAIKPQSLRNVAEDLGAIGSPDKLLVSLLAGVPIRVLAESFEHTRVIRVMPNTPCLIGCGASAFAVGPGASAEDSRQVEILLRTVGSAWKLEEKHLDAVTGLSGSGPAYVYTFIEALSDGGVRVGLPRDVATALAAQTVLGAAQMVLSTGEHTAVLRDRVTSPAGTTIAGLQVIERCGLRSAVIDAVEAATRRSAELGNVHG